MLHAVKPQPFVYLHTFGSTANPKLYPIDYQAANMSAKDAAFWCHQQPVEKRWKCQMQTSLPFHLSFQNPVWRSLMCGTACAFPVLGASFTTIPMAKLVPDPPELLDSLYLSKADIVYASPDLLQAMLEKAASHNSKEIWREAVRNLKEAHTGGAPVSVEKADCFERHGLSVLQVFALTEAGLLFQGRKEHTGHLTWLKPLPSKKTHMLFRQTAADPELYQLWLRSDFPGLRCPSDKIVPYPEDPKILAWNTLDTFRKLPTMGEHDDLVTFAGREDDWLRCTHGTAVRALELEDFLLEALRDVLGFDRVRALTVIGHGRYALGIVLQGNTLGRVPEDREVEAFERVWHFASKKLLQNPEQVRYLIRTDLTSPIQMTLKGNPLRGHNEIRFGPKLVQLIKDAEAKASTSEKEP
ncbi:hypothetical protein BCV69DRAFT_219965 [Microstroma glucosiphilum]|uniref:AMP-dependent synthetase/ligase domain-containing protein n=1 Tax=Pseudomicrostroma glucosiphilum TaxID=1684307 RepID=A0A316UAP3_9BASI|nr:hypothetical protein BCV69DRAFT_219965 [Pseudomicrostroma glucosiphilum]PWN20105.1 hypothetical protein BCV69DRAFT_219965 [Pseudomicrostroma glucosiphilum]